MGSKIVSAAAFCLIAVGFSNAYAYPVVGDQAIFQDDKDSNLYYFHPDRMVLASDSASKRKQYGCFDDGTLAYANATFAFEISDELNESFAVIKKSNPNAKFAALPLRTTQFIDQHVTNLNFTSCDGRGGAIGSNMLCNWEINGANACAAFKKAAASPSGIHILDFSFTFLGIVQGQTKEVTRTVPVIIYDLE